MTKPYLFGRNLPTGYNFRLKSQEVCTSIKIVTIVGKWWKTEITFGGNL